MVLAFRGAESLGEDPYNEEIRDPVAGYVYLSQTEKKVLDTLPLQRLRRIKQLAFSYLGYPGAVHTRFDHSIGTCHLSWRIAKRLGLSDEDIMAVRMAGLLHDVGHAPLSHIGEYVLEKYSPSWNTDQKHSNAIHEMLSVLIVRQYEPLRRVLDGPGGPGSEKVAEIIEHKPPPTLAKSIISGEIDADRLDYLLRDCHFTGVKYGIYDLERIVNTLLPIETEDGTRLAVKEEGVYAVEQLLLARYHMHAQVYNHKTRLVADEMAKRGLDLAIEEKSIDPTLFSIDEIPKKLDAYLGLDDESIFAQIISHKGTFSEDLFSRLKERRLLCKIYEIEINPSTIRDAQERFALSALTQSQRAYLEEQVAKELGVPKELTIAQVWTFKSPGFAYERRNRLDPKDVMVVRKDKTSESFPVMSKVLSDELLKRPTECLFVYAPLEEDGGNENALKERMKSFMPEMIKDWRKLTNFT
jgi:HD superfamily phosphohydrolase